MMRRYSTMLYYIKGEAEVGILNLYSSTSEEKVEKYYHNLISYVKGEMNEVFNMEV